MLRQRSYPVTYTMRQMLCVEFEDMKNFGIIRKGNSPYASSLVGLEKAGGSNLICIDYRQLNQQTVFYLTP
ncbi:reverse transcriptase (RNA-dependent DNA polymerase) [Plakobranchus ocellatus]|uniref:Reverse transcriptase (RNA-dependent DNA polymerase) n=1 Tax=Plakobranchus ocellatus TaxID=259542 RepID=A0AAV4AGV1_9GAST|nr:reverse transcriptase (RNA-dependent DNA polymerase) [Plakobranchus ocellatus]